MTLCICSVSRSRFILGKSWLVFTLVLFVLSQSIFEHLTDSFDETPEAQQVAIFAPRAFIYIFALFSLLIDHLRMSYKACQAKDTFKVWFLPVPGYLLAVRRGPPPGRKPSCTLGTALIGVICLSEVQHLIPTNPGQYVRPRGRRTIHLQQHQGCW